MYANLRAEMARKNVKVTDIAAATGKTEKTVRTKLAGNTDWTIGEAAAIRAKFFPDCSFDYLFSKG